MEQQHLINLVQISTTQHALLMSDIKNHAKALTAYYEECQKTGDDYLNILYKVLDYELAHLSRLGQEKLSVIYLSAICHKGGLFDINLYPLHKILIECIYRARKQKILAQTCSGGFIWQLVIDALQSHLLDWIISPIDYNVKDKLINHLKKLLPLLAT